MENFIICISQSNRGWEQEYSIKYYSLIRSFQSFQIHVKIHVGIHVKIHVEINAEFKILVIVSDRTVILDTVTH